MGVSKTTRELNYLRKSKSFGIRINLKRVSLENQKDGHVTLLHILEIALMVSNIIIKVRNFKIGDVNSVTSMSVNNVSKFQNALKKRLIKKMIQ